MTKVSTVSNMLSALIDRIYDQLEKNNCTFTEWWNKQDIDTQHEMTILVSYSEELLTMFATDGKDENVRRERNRRISYD